MPNGVCDYFLMWICVGLPFGIRRMCLWRVPSGYGIPYWRPAEIAPKGPAGKANCGAKEKAITEFFQILYTEQ